MRNFSARTRRDGARSFFAIVLATSSALALAGAAAAQERTAAAAEQSVAYDIPAQALDAALLRFAEQTGVQVLFARAHVRPFRSTALHGVHPPRQALNLLLGDTGVRAELTGDTLVIREIPQRHTQSGSADDTIGAPAAPTHVAEAEDADLVITGTRIRGAPPAGSNVLSLDRDAIDATGRGTVQDVVATLPQNFPGSQNELTQLGATDGRRNIAFGSTVDLRGLGADATLTLVNGRRLAPSGFGNFVDLSLIPLSAVRSIDVLADGASATYGSDAVGGVVNVILDSEFEGAVSRVRVGRDGHGGMDEFAAAQLIGASWETGHAMMGYDYRERGALAAADRDTTSNSDLRRYGGSNFSRTLSNPGNITRIGAIPASWAIPTGQDGTSLSQADLIAGSLNQQDINEDSYLLPEQRSHSIFLSARQQATPHVEVFVDALAGVREAYAQDTQIATSIVIPETNYYRQLNGLFLGQGNLTIGYYFGADLGPIRHVTSSQGHNVAAGAEIALWDEWRLELVGSHALVQEDARIENTFESSPAVTAAYASNAIATAFNPFADGSNTPASVLAAFTYDQHIDTDSEIRTFAAKADGPLFDLPGGVLRAALGLERRQESFTIDREFIRTSGITRLPIQAPGERTIEAVFAEILAPVTDTFQISASVRQERSDTFDATTPKIGVSWAIAGDLTLRATWGLSFKAPQFQQMLGATSGTLTSATAAQDPQATNGSTGLLILGGSNPNLVPEEAESWTAGFTYRPRIMRGLSLDAAYFDIDFANRIATPGNVLAAFRDPTGLETVFTRNPTLAQVQAAIASVDTVAGSLPLSSVEAIFDGRLSNLASLRVRGIDLSAGYAFATRMGEFTLNASASGLLQYERMTVPGAAGIEALNTMFNPVDWRARLSLAWQAGDWSAGVTGIYVDSYRDNLSTPTREIDSSLTFDMRAGFALDARGSEISLSVQNVFDEDPPFANNPLGFAFDAQNASPVGRLFAVEIRKRW